MLYEVITNNTKASFYLHFRCQLILILLVITSYSIHYTKLYESSVSEQISINGKDLWGLKFKLKVNNEDLIGNIVSEENTINEHGVVIHTIDFKYRNEKIYGEYYYYDQKYIYNSLDGNKSFNGEIDYKTNSVKINLGNKNIRGIIKNGITLCNADIVEYEMILHQLMDIYLGYLA